MKLIIQIPCFNEEATLPITLSELPRSVDGFDSVEWLIIDDGCTDNTALVAKQNGVDHIVQLKQNQGLAKAFTAGLERCIALGADVIVNTDADNQYQAKDIGKLVEPILEYKADYVIGERSISETEHFSVAKKVLQKIGSWVVKQASGTDIPDAPSGFRAISNSCARQLNVYSHFTYTLETIIQAGQKRMIVMSVPVRTNSELRPSRLFKNNFAYIKESTITIVRIFVVYRPFRFFFTIATLLTLLGVTIGMRFLYYWLTGDGEGRVQSVILSGLLIGIGFQAGLIAFVADLLAVNRKLLEDLKKK